MRLLFLTNFYPPVELGGWEQLCQEIVDAFILRGHEVVVLTSRFNKEQVVHVEPHVHRNLYLESHPYHYDPLSVAPHFLYRDAHNLNCLRAMVNEHKPDTIFIWGMWLLNPQLAVLAEDLCPGRVAYYMAGYWPVNDFEGDPHSVYWKLPSNKPWVRLGKKPIAWAVTRTLQQRRVRSPQLTNVACVSKFVLEELQRRGLALAKGRVIYNGIDISKFYYPVAGRQLLKQAVHPLRLLFSGAITPQKGTDTAIQSLARLSSRFGPDQVQLTIVGAGSSHFVEDLHRLVEREQLEPFVRFSGWVPRDQVPQRMKDSDVMLFTSSWEEPLARSMMEGMAAGLALVSTATGGSAEFLKHDVNALTFTANDPNDLSMQIERLLLEPGLVARIAAGGQETALAHFNLNRMVDEVEAFVCGLS